MDGYWNVNFACRGSAGSPMWVRMAPTVGAPLMKVMISTSPPQWGELRPFVQWTNAARRTTCREAGLEDAPGKDGYDDFRAEQRTSNMAQR
jgi:hypothetical protein